MTTPKGLGFLNLGIYIFGALFLLIGWLIARNIWDGLLLGLAMMGIATSIVYAILHHFSSHFHEDVEKMRKEEQKEGGLSRAAMIIVRWEQLLPLQNCGNFGGNFGFRKMP